MKLPKDSEQEKKRQELDSIFAFKDPRLRHLNKDFRREELQVSFPDFHHSNEMQAALDQIIQFNSMTLEFNYMLDIYHSLKKLVVEKTGSPDDYASLFSVYDQNHDNLLDKNELREMILAAGHAGVTEAEV